MSDTPRTDKYVLSGAQRSRQDMIEYAKKLERELAATNANGPIVVRADGSTCTMRWWYDEKLAARDAEIERLRKAIAPFAQIMIGTSGRVPTERLSFADWHSLSRAYFPQPKEPT
jgi:hypothetical protein